MKPVLKIKIRLKKPIVRAFVCPFCGDRMITTDKVWRHKRCSGKPNYLLVFAFSNGHPTDSDKEPKQYLQAMHARTKATRRFK